MVASDASAPPPGPSGADPSAPGVKVSPEGMTQFANDVQTLWDGTLGPQGVAAPDGIAGDTDTATVSASPHGAFGPHGQAVGLDSVHADFRQAALQLLNEVTSLMGAVPTKVAGSAQVYTAADQTNAANLFGA